MDCSTAHISDKNNAIVALDGLKFSGANNATCQPGTIELQVQSKQTEWSPGQLPTGFQETEPGKKVKGAVTFWGAAGVGVGVIILFYFAIRMKWIKL